VALNQEPQLPQETLQNKSHENLERHSRLFGLMLGGFDGVWDDDFRRAASIGATVARVNIWWPHVEHSPGALDFTPFERVLASAEANGLQVIVTVWGSPPWHCSVPGAEREDNCPPRPEAFRALMQTLVSRYHDRVLAWEIWNEPEQPNYWFGAPDTAGYARLLRAAYQGAKAGDSEALVLFAATGYIQFDYVEHVLWHLGGEAAFDAVAVHPYRRHYGPHEPIENVGAERTTLKDELLLLTNLFENYGYGRPDLYLTELGWGTNHEADRPALELVTLDDQARFVAETIHLINTDPGLQHVKAVTFFIQRDSDSTEEEQWSYYGLSYRDGRPKPAAAAFRDMVYPD
jgi:hypothetical protein